MSRMNSRNRAKFYKLLTKRDGERCNICKKAGTIDTLVIDHKNNDNSDNRPENLQLLCHSDNSKKNPRGKGKKQSPESIRGDEHQEKKAYSPEFKKNQEAEPVFRHWLFEMVRKRSRMSLDDVLNGGAEKSVCSQSTINRYLQKECSIEGKYIVSIGEDGKKYIEFNQEYASKLVLNDVVTKSEDLHRLVPIAKVGQG